ncbi:hypothetical protein [Caballeronia novacaledonica]|uniref:Uncharacterized protein n=1 Tax=Caballeronia novacaledonica TaxID=1544861 RepID=A0AA37MG19_9BURK|nr:hypothetical protein [Caballeronia novacaledonica]GJH23700.1 hypothetical protein CBA19CS42_04310 [Caballeronia novacaledonica]
MDVTQIRYRNFKHLFEQFKEVVRRDDPSAPEMGMLKLFGDRVGVREAYMSHINTKYKGIDTTTARKMKQALKLPHGWMDQQQEQPKAKQQEPMQQEQTAQTKDDLQRVFELCRRKDAAKTMARLLSLLEELG